MKTYKGPYTVKNPFKYRGDHRAVVYRSRWEYFAFKFCDENSQIVEWNSEEVVIPYYYDVTKRYHRYFMDLYIKFHNGKVILVEIKPAHQTQPPKSDRKTKRYINEATTYVQNQNKWKAASKYAADRGWQFQVWTEVELTAMGILPKAVQPVKGSPGKMKKMKPYRKKPKKS